MMSGTAGLLVGHIISVERSCMEATTTTAHADTYRLTSTPQLATAGRACLR